MPEDMPDRMPEDLPDRMPEDMPEHMPEDMPDRMPDRMPEDMSDRMPEDLPDRMPEDMPEHMPEDMPDRMPEDMSDRMPEDLPVRKCINAMVGIIRSEVIVVFPRCAAGIALNCFWAKQDWLEHGATPKAKQCKPQQMHAKGNQTTRQPPTSANIPTKQNRQTCQTPKQPAKG